MSRIIILDTETTGLNVQTGDRLVEVGCVELVNRRLTGNHFHRYVNPERDVPHEAQAIHGLTYEFLSDKPLFADIVDEFLHYIDGAELVIHNAPFDVGFLDHELSLIAKSRGVAMPRIGDICEITDSLVMARQKHPGQKNSLDALCSRYYVENSHRELHGALLDSEILADVYLAMTGGQTSLLLGDEAEVQNPSQTLAPVNTAISGARMKVIYANADELQTHEAKLATIAEVAGAQSYWHELELDPDTNV